MMLSLLTGWALPSAALLGLAAILVVLAVGYMLGRREGFQKGCALAEAEAPLRLREAALRNGNCAVCGNHSVGLMADGVGEGTDGGG